jgi:hypothetical protein
MVANRLELWRQAQRAAVATAARRPGESAAGVARRLEPLAESDARRQPGALRLTVGWAATVPPAAQQSEGRCAAAVLRMAVPAAQHAESAQALVGPAERHAGVPAVVPRGAVAVPRRAEVARAGVAAAVLRQGGPGAAEGPQRAAAARDVAGEGRPLAAPDGARAAQPSAAASAPACRLGRLPPDLAPSAAARFVLERAN